MSDPKRVDLAEVSWAFGASETGKRERDEDYVACDEFGSVRVGVICDGMGGGQSGELASEIAARVFITGVRRIVGELGNSWPDDEARHEAYAEVIGHCHDSVGGISEVGDSGTTLTAVVATFDEGGSSSVDLVHIGDSRCYRVLDGRADLLTNDHSVTGDMVRAGYIQMHEIEETSGKNTLTKNIGDEGSSKADVSTINSEGGSFLLCCDGVWGPLHGVSGLWLTDSDFCSQEMAVGMVEKAIERGSSDNCSVLIVDLGP